MGFVQQTMKIKYKMREVWIGDDSIPDSPKCNIFISDDFYTNTGRCLVLIQGTGAVRAGFWARSVCINYGLYLGSVLPLLDFAKATGQSVIVLNPNMSRDPLSGESIPHCATMTSHCNYVW